MLLGIDSSFQITDEREMIFRDLWGVQQLIKSVNLFLEFTEIFTQFLLESTHFYATKHVHKTFESDDNNFNYK